MKNYMQHVGLTAWRKKSTLLFAAALLALIIFGLHYSQLDERGKIETGRVSSGPVEVVAALLQSANVRFLNMDQKQKQSTVNKEYTEALAHRNGEDEFNEVNHGNYETDQQLGIPYVNLDLKNPYIPKQRIVHFDLKGAPPRVTYLKKVFSLIRNLGATGILLGK